MKTTRLFPFGLQVLSRAPGQPLDTLHCEEVEHWLRDHRMVMLRGFDGGDEAAMLAFCSLFGEVLPWEFGAIHQVEAVEASPNYLYLPEAVPFHWDGAFEGRAPHYIFFHCLWAPPVGSGGETTFANSAALLERATPEQLERWSQVKITYRHHEERTEPLVGVHPETGERVLRLAEPVANSVELRFDPPESVQVLAELQPLLYSPEFCHEHEWRDGDVLLADNHALLHGRRAYQQKVRRHLRRVNIL